MDIKILLLICYNAVSIGESYYAPPESLEHSVVSQLQNGNRRLDSDVDNEHPDQHCCFPKNTISTSLEEQLDPHNNSLQRLVVYMYLNVLSDQAYLYIPSRDKQTLFPSLNFEQGDVLQNLTDKAILEKNTNISILINNTSTQPIISDTVNITSADINASINKSQAKNIIEPSTKPNNFQSSNLLNAYNSEQQPDPTNKPNLFQTPSPNSRSNTNKNRWENLRSNDYAEHPSKSPLEYNDPEYGTPPFITTPIKRGKNPVPPTIGFNQLPYMSQVPGQKLNLSHIIVPSKNKIVSFARNDQARKSNLQPYGLILDNSGNEVSLNMIEVPVKLNLIRVPQNHNTISLDKGSILPLNLIRAPPNYSKVGESPVNLKAVPESQNSYNLVVEPNIIQVPPNLPNLGGSSENLEVDLNVMQVPSSLPNLLSRPDNLVVNPYMNQVPPNNPNLEGTPDTLRVDPNAFQVPQNLPNLVSSTDYLEVDPYMNQVPPNHPNLEGTPDTSRVDPKVIQALQKHSNLVNGTDNLEVDPYVNQDPPKRQNLGGNPENLEVDLNIIPNNIRANNLREKKFKPYMMRIPQTQPQLLRMNYLFSDWFYNQIATANQGMAFQINIDTLRREIIRTLARYNMYISDGYLIDAHGNIISWDYLQLRAILVGEPMKYETVINSPDPTHFKPSNTYWKALLTTFGPSSETVILDIIPLGKMQRLDKSCTSGGCAAIIPDQVGNQAMLTKLQNYMQLQAQQLNIEQLLNRRKLGLKLDPRKEPLEIYNTFKAQKGQENLKKRKDALTQSGRREKDIIEKGMSTMRPRTNNNHRVNDVVDWRIIGGAAATSSGAPISVRGRSGYIL